MLLSLYMYRRDGLTLTGIKSYQAKPGRRVRHCCRALWQALGASLQPPRGICFKLQDVIRRQHLVGSTSLKSLPLAAGDVYSSSLSSHESAYRQG